MPPPLTKGEGGHIGFSIVRVGIGVPVGVDFPLLLPRYLLNQWVECHRLCMDVSLGQA